MSPESKRCGPAARVGCGQGRGCHRAAAKSVVARSDSDAPVPHLSRRTVSEGKQPPTWQKEIASAQTTGLAMTVNGECNSNGGVTPPLALCAVLR